MRIRRAPPMNHAVCSFRKRRYCPIYPAIHPSGRRTRMVPILNEIVSLRILESERVVFPLVRYPMRPRHKTLLHGQIPAISPNINIPERDGSKIGIILLKLGKVPLGYRIYPVTLMPGFHIHLIDSSRSAMYQGGEYS